MIFQLTGRLLAETDKRVLVRFLRNGVWKGWRSMRSFQRRSAAGGFSPAFLFVSLTDRCNLSCRGCWVTAAEPGREWDPAELDRLISAYKTENRTFFFGLLGGEPLLYPHLIDFLGRHRDCYFQLLTNGTLLTDAIAADFRRLGNVTPLISIEGDSEESDRRRGGDRVHARTMAALEACRRSRLIFGVASSLCKRNVRDLASDGFIRRMIECGAHYLWYYIYRPVGPDPAPELALDADEILSLRRFLVEARCRHPIVLIDAYWDAAGRALCPAAVGLSHHIGPGGDIEPCPPLQFSRDSIRSGDSVNVLFRDSVFLPAFRETAASLGGGCILLDDPALLRDLLVRSAARDTSGRGTGLAEIAAMRPRPGHHQPGHEIPEKHWFYRLAKRNAFCGFGTYG